jgi:hypothetical protein
MVKLWDVGPDWRKKVARGMILKYILFPVHHLSVFSLPWSDLIGLDKHSLPTYLPEAYNNGAKQLLTETFKTVSQNKSLLFLSCLCHVFCHSDWK